MLRIKEDVNLERLKEFGYKSEFTLMGYDYSKNCDDGRLYIAHIHRIITLMWHPDKETLGVCRELPMTYMYIKDLVDAGLVEEVIF